MQNELFPCEKTYVIDTSSLVHLEQNFDRESVVYEAVWQEIEELVGQGCFKTLEFVWEELKDYQGDQDGLMKWIRKWKKHLIIDTDAEVLNAARPIINEEYNTGFFKASKQAEGKDEADPYLIAYCKVNFCTLITNEKFDVHNKIPAVARKNGVECMNINGFLIDRGLKMERKKK